jgi:hypothetical protein
MKRALLLISIPVIAVAFALIVRPGSLGARLKDSATMYCEMMSTGGTEQAENMMSPEMSEGLSVDFLARLDGTEVPSHFRFDGSDTRGIRMAGSVDGGGSRVIWFSTEHGLKVTGDTAVDNILGSAVMLCRENAVSDPEGYCPVSERPYQYDEAAGIVVCPEGHLGEGLPVGSDHCALRRDSVTAELAGYIEAGYDCPETLEEMFTVSEGIYGRRGGYRCPDNGYKYYELRDGAVYCPFHEEYSGVEVTQ